MSNWPVQTGGGAPVVGAAIDNDVRYRRLTAGAANTPGAWVEVVSSAPRGMVGLAVQTANDVTGAVERSLFDLAIGAAGSELVVAPAIPCIGSSFRFGGDGFVLPITAAPGTRISARVQSSVAATQMFGLTVVPVVGGSLAPVAASTLVAFGDDRAASRGTLVQNNYAGGAWVQLAASTPRKLRGLFICYSGDGAYNQHVTRIAAGAAGAEVPIIERLATQRGENANHPHIVGPFWVSIPAGSRLAAQTFSGTTPINPYVHLLGIE